jgi:thiamine-phosphate pyrophosphorylase
MHQFQRLILITNRGSSPLSSYLDFVYCCAQGGITALQLREKSAPHSFLLEFGRELKRLLAPFQIPLIVNDDVELARTLDADGVHLGQNDGDSLDALRALGPEKIIGLSIERLEDVECANQQAHVSYVAASAVFLSKNKHNIKKVWGLDGLQTIVSRSSHAVVAVGGINRGNVEQVMSSGAAGIAVIEAIHSSHDSEKAVRALRQIVDEHLEVQHV